MYPSIFFSERAIQRPLEFPELVGTLLRMQSEDSHPAVREKACEAMLEFVRDQPDATLPFADQIIAATTKELAQAKVPLSNYPI